MSRLLERGDVEHPFHYSTLLATFLATFCLFVLLPGAPFTAALISLAGVVTGLRRCLVPGCVRLPWQKVNLPMGQLDGLIAVTCLTLPLCVALVVLLA